MKKILILVGVIILVIIIASIYKFNFTNNDIYIRQNNGEVKKYDDVIKNINSFEDCENAGFAIMESYPEQCSDGKNTFTRKLSDEEKINSMQNNEDEGMGYVYEVEVDSAEECTEFEEYDSELSVCFFECDSEKECATIEDKIDSALDGLDEDYEDFAKNFKEFEGDSSELEENAEVVYKIEKGEKFVVVSGDEKAKHIKIKKWLAAISPNKFSDTYLNRLIPYTKENDDTAAFVAPSEGSNKWDTYVNMNSMEDGDKEMVFTLIHEFAHILTLNSSQVDKVVDEESCNYFIQEGCVKDNAYISIFYHKFWKGKFDSSAQDSYENYDKNPSAFVTEYAATNTGEDIAESFASFVFKKKPNADTIAEQKISFFYEYSELIKIRDSIRDILKPIIRSRIVQ